MVFKGLSGVALGSINMKRFRKVFEQYPELLTKCYIFVGKREGSNFCICLTWDNYSQLNN